MTEKRKYVELGRVEDVPLGPEPTTVDIPLTPGAFDDIPRRNRLDLNTTAELAIRGAVDAVEDFGAHRLLTEAVILLGQAREKVADYVDGLENEPAE